MGLCEKHSPVTLVTCLPQAHGPETSIHLHGKNSSRFPDTGPAVAANSSVSNDGDLAMVLQKQ